MIPPFFNVTPVSKIYPVAGRVRLGCEALGVPKPKITWFKNGKPLVIEPRMKIYEHEIVFIHTFSDDAGEYKLVKYN